jgi:2-hydroxychromene-2-carboxylate isomerase
MAYYDEIHEIEITGLGTVYIKFKHIPVVKLFTYQTMLGQAFGNNQKDNDERLLEKCYTFIFENTTFSRERDGRYDAVKLVGLDNFQLKEIEEDFQVGIGIVGLFIESVYKTTEKN